MVKVVEGDILEDDVDAIANPITTSGQVGPGLNGYVTELCPENFDWHHDLCTSNQLQLGGVGVFVIDQDRYMLNSEFIMNIPIRVQYTDKVDIGAVEAGMRSIITVIPSLIVGTIAIPAFGCGHGGLQWKDVLDCIVHYCQYIRNVDVRIYQPMKDELRAAVYPDEFEDYQFEEQYPKYNHWKV